MRRLRNAFVTGLLVLMPLMATVDILRWFFQFIDQAVRNYLPHLPFDFWGLGILVSVVLITLTGLLTHNYVGRWIIALADRTVRRFPLVGGIYGGIKKFLETVFSPSSNQFKHAVLVEFPSPGFHSIGFVTGDPDPVLLTHFDQPMMNIFIPLVPNPISGYYVLVPADKVKPLNLTVQEALRMAISMGIVGSDEAKKKVRP
jgi:uncharacterized membrane protein